MAEDAMLTSWEKEGFGDAAGATAGVLAEAPSESSMESLVHEEQIRTLFSKGMTALIVNLINALVLVAALWPVVALESALSWLASMYAIVGGRLLLWRSHRWALGYASYDVTRWRRVWLVGTFATGVLWGSTTWVLFPASSGDQNLLLFLIGGMVAGASATMSSFPLAFVAFALPALTPAVARLLSEGDRGHLAMAVLLVSFGVAMTLIAQASGRSFAAAVRLRLRNLVLFRELTSAREALTGLNQDLEERVRRRTDDLQRTLQERDQFVSIVSHELRTPLTSMKLNHEMLARSLRDGPPDAPEVERRTGTLRRQLKRMQRLLDDLLDVGRLSTHRMRYRKEQVEMKAIVEAALDEMAPQLSAADARFACDVPSGLVGEWDGSRLQQVLINLMSNALRYGRMPFALTARRAGEQVELSVQDSGGSISQEALGRIFGAFERAHGQSTSEGLGLGLYIADQIVRAHAGSISAKSSPEHGTTFVVQLPLVG